MSSAPTSRLQFIDSARSIAIILMLQGHFISLTYEHYLPMLKTLRSTGTSGNLLFDIWCYVRGFTAPLFFSITGLIFTYLLLREKETPVFQQERVRKGIKRAVIIILLGYLLQLDIQSLSYYLSGNIGSRFFAFHVLQCIGFGILAIVALYIIQRTLLRKVSFIILLTLACIAVFTLYPIIKSYGNQIVPINVPAFLQNMIHGKHSVFPIIPWFGYIFFGGILGAILRTYQHRVKDQWFAIKLLTGIILLNLALRGSFLLIDVVTNDQFNYSASAAIFDRFTQIGLLLALLIYLDRYAKLGQSLFIRMGQNTLVIYVLHIILLYGAFVGIGITTFYKHNLNGWLSVIGALLFVVFFAGLTHLQPKLKRVFQLPFSRKKHTSD